MSAPGGDVDEKIGNAGLPEHLEHIDMPGPGPEFNIGPDDGQFSVPDEAVEAEVEVPAASTPTQASAPQEAEAEAQKGTECKQIAPSATVGQEGKEGSQCLQIGPSATVGGTLAKMCPCAVCGTPTQVKPGKPISVCAQDLGKQRSFHDQAARAGKLNELMELMTSKPDEYLKLFREWLAQRLGWTIMQSWSVRYPSRVASSLGH